MCLRKWTHHVCSHTVLGAFTPCERLVDLYNLSSYPEVFKVISCTEPPVPLSTTVSLSPTQRHHPQGIAINLPGGHPVAIIEDCIARACESCTNLERTVGPELNKTTKQRTMVRPQGRSAGGGKLGNTVDEKFDRDPVEHAKTLLATYAWKNDKPQGGKEDELTKALDKVPKQAIWREPEGAARGKGTADMDKKFQDTNHLEPACVPKTEATHPFTSHDTARSVCPQAPNTAILEVESGPADLSPHNLKLSGTACRKSAVHFEEAIIAPSETPSSFQLTTSSSFPALHYDSSSRPGDAPTSYMRTKITSSVPDYSSSSSLSDLPSRTPTPPTPMSARATTPDLWNTNEELEDSVSETSRTSTTPVADTTQPSRRSEIEQVMRETEPPPGSRMLGRLFTAAQMDILYGERWRNKTNVVRHKVSDLSSEELGKLPPADVARILGHRLRRQQLSTAASVGAVASEPYVADQCRPHPTAAPPVRRNPFCRADRGSVPKSNATIHDTKDKVFKRHHSSSSSDASPHPPKIRKVAMRPSGHPTSVPGMQSTNQTSTSQSNAEKPISAWKLRKMKEKVQRGGKLTGMYQKLAGLDRPSVHSGQASAGQTQVYRQMPSRIAKGKTVIEETESERDEQKK